MLTSTNTEEQLRLLHKKGKGVLNKIYFSNTGKVFKGDNKGRLLDISDTYTVQGDVEVLQNELQICNYSYINQICGHNHSGITNPVWVISPDTMRGYYGKAQNDDNIEQIKRDSFPTGTNPPYSLILGDKGSLLSSTTIINGDSSITSGLAMGKALEASLAGTSSITDAQLSLIIQLASTIASSGDITTASLVGTIALAATLTSTGNLTAGLNVIAYLNSTLSGTGSISGALLNGIASMEATIYVNQSEATVQQLVEGVWNALTADYNNANTMGEVMNNMGAASDPWGTSLPGAYAAGEAGYIIGNLLSNIPASVWDELKATHTTATSYGKIVQDLETLSRQIKALTAAQL